MSKRTKLLWTGLIIGLIGVAVTIGIGVGTYAIMSRETTKTYCFDEPFDTIEFPDKDGIISEIKISEGDYKVKAFIKAWRPGPIDIDSILDFSVYNGELYITVTPFPDDFLGMFPQPYELNIEIFTPLGDSLKTDWENAE